MEYFLEFFNSRRHGSSNRPVVPMSLLKQSIHEVHKNSLKTLCSGSAESFNELRVTLQRLPEIIQEQIFADLMELSDRFPLIDDIKFSLPNEWTQKYFCLLIHVISTEYKHCKEWSEYLKLLPDVVKADLLEGLENNFWPNGFHYRFLMKILHKHLK